MSQKQISSVDLMFLTKELQNLVNQRIETFYFEDMTFYLRIYIRGLGHKYLTVNLGKSFYLGDEKKESSHPNPVIQFFRKHLKPSFIRSVEQIGTERILKLEIEKKIGEDTSEPNNIKIRKYNMYFELFGNGNVILTDENDIILNSLTKKTFKDRTIKIKEKYEFPPENPLNINNIDKEILNKEISETDLSIVKFLAIKFGMGGKFAEYICEKLQIDKNQPAQDTNQENLIKELENLKSQNIQAYTDKNHTDFYPIKFDNKKDLESCENFNQALLLHFAKHNIKVDNREKEFEKELKKLKNRLKKQEQSKEQTLKDYEKQNEIGTKIFEHYSTVEELLTNINKAAKEKGWEHVQNIIDNNEQLSKLVKKLNYKNDEIILSLE